MSFGDFVRTDDFKLLLAAVQEEEEARMRRLAEMARTESEATLRYEAGVIAGLRVALIALPQRILDREHAQAQRPLYTMSDSSGQSEIDKDDGY